MVGRSSPLNTTASIPPASTRAWTSSSFPRPTNVRLSGRSRRWTMVSTIRWPADAKRAEISPTSAVRDTRRTSNAHLKGPARHERFQWKSRGGAIPAIPRRDAKPLSPAEAIGIRIMQVQVRLFATYREIVGAGQLAWTLRDGTTVGQLVDAVLAKYPRLVGHGNSMLLAVNHEVVRSDSILREGDEVALLPPVSGGAR